MVSCSWTHHGGAELHGPRFMTEQSNSAYGRLETESDRNGAKVRHIPKNYPSDQVPLTKATSQYPSLHAEDPNSYLSTHVGGITPNFCSRVT